MALYLDISQWQDQSIDWNLLKQEVGGIIIRIGYRGWGSAGTLAKDANFDNFCKNANAHGIPTGCYFFTQAKNAAEGKAEAQYALPFYKKTNMKLPLFIDTEWSTAKNHTGRADGISNAKRTDACVAFMEAVKAAGCRTGIYASASWFKDKLQYDRVKNYLKWVAAYGSSENALRNTWGIASWYLWQYTSSGSLDAYNGKKKDMLDFSVPGADFGKAPAQSNAPQASPTMQKVYSCKDLKVQFDYTQNRWRTWSNTLKNYVDYTGVAPNEYQGGSWWYVKNGYLDWNYTGWANNDLGRWWISKGACDFRATVDRAAALVWRGTFGNGKANRKKNMMAAGFSAKQFDEIQAAVDKGVGRT